MRISFEREGGLAALPGLMRPITVDTEQLPPDEATRWQQLVRDAEAWSAPSTARSATRDGRIYRIALEDGPRCARFEVCDPLPPRLRPLVRALEEKLKQR